MNYFCYRPIRSIYIQLTFHWAFPVESFGSSLRLFTSRFPQTGYFFLLFTLRDILIKYAERNADAVERFQLLNGEKISVFINSLSAVTSSFAFQIALCGDGRRESGCFTKASSTRSSKLAFSWIRRAFERDRTRDLIYGYWNQWRIHTPTRKQYFCCAIVLG